MSSNELRIDDCRGKLGTPGKVLAYRGLSVGMGDSEAEAIADLERAERRLAAWPVVYDPRVGVPNDIRLIRSRSLTFGSLFAGIGGIDLGLERAGMHCLWQVEKDDYASKVLAKHWPDVARFRDVRDCGAGNLDAVDLIAGGFPCQPHSLAGKRQGSADDRDLWGEFARVIRELRPRWVLAENVPGLLSSENGRFFGRVLGDLAALGYDAEWHCISAAAVGAPHLRNRVFIVADADSERQQKQRWTEPATKNRARLLTNLERSDQWCIEPGICRMAHGVPHRVDRLRGLGNAVVPQVAEFISRQIVAMHEAQYAH